VFAGIYYKRFFQEGYSSGRETQTVLAAGAGKRNTFWVLTGASAGVVEEKP
jgi:hypothetical protein